MSNFLLVKQSKLMKSRNISGLFIRIIIPKDNYYRSHEFTLENSPCPTISISTASTPILSSSISTLWKYKMLHQGTWYFREHDTSGSTIHQGRQYFREHDTSGNMILQETRYIREHDTLGNTIHQATWYITEHDTSGNKKHQATWYIREHNSSGNMAKLYITLAIFFNFAGLHVISKHFSHVFIFTCTHHVAYHPNCLTALVGSNISCNVHNYMVRGHWILNIFYSCLIPAFWILSLGTDHGLIPFYNTQVWNVNTIFYIVGLLY